MESVTFWANSPMGADPSVVKCAPYSESTIPDPIQNNHTNNHKKNKYKNKLKNMIERSEYVSKYVFQERGVTCWPKRLHSPFV